MSSKAKNSFIIIDGSSYLYRAYYALPALTNKLKEPTWVIYGVLNMLKKILKKNKPRYIVIIFDNSAKTFRHNLYPKYKTNRQKMPNNLSIQIKPLFKIITAIGLPLISIPGIESDDIIGTLATNAAMEGAKVLINSNDKDMLQLITNNIHVINDKKNIIFDPKTVELKFGFSPKMIIDYLALTGDISDNIPGIPGIGKKTAQILLKKYNNLSSIYCNLDKIHHLNLYNTQYILNSLKNHHKTAILSYKLASIKTNIKLSKTWKQLKIHEPNIKILTYYFQKYEFKTWLKEIKTINNNYKIIV